MSEGSTFSYWERDTFLSPWNLIVVGAGIVGLSAALFYRHRHPGASVLVLEKGVIPDGASTRNAGFACIGSITEHMADLEKESKEKIEEGISMRYRGLQLLRSTLGDEAIGYEPSGGYEIFTSQEKFEEATEHISMFNHRLRELTGKKNVYKAVTLNGYPVIQNSLEGMLHPGYMMQALTDRVINEGVHIRWSSPVTEVTGSGGMVLNSGIELKGDQVLLACNGFIRRLLPEVPVIPARGYIMVTNEQKELPWRGTFHYDRGYIYFRNLGNRLLIGGARNVAVDEETTDQPGINPAVKRHLNAFVNDVIKLPAGWEVDYEWTGIMGFTDSKTPIVKRLDNHSVVAAGLSGMGVAIGMQIGKDAADLLNNVKSRPE